MTRLRFILVSFFAAVAGWWWTAKHPDPVTTNLEGCFRIGSQVSLLPPLTEDEIKQIMVEISCYSCNEEIRTFCRSDAFQVKYRIPEREAAMQEQRRRDRLEMVENFVTQPRTA